MEEMNDFYNQMQEYGDVSTGNKGNFSIKSADGRKRVDFKKQTISAFDERAALADHKLKNFLLSFGKRARIYIRRSQNTFKRRSEKNAR